MKLALLLLHGTYNHPLMSVCKARGVAGVAGGISFNPSFPAWLAACYGLLDS